jgi:hypothetical protein
MTSGSVESMTSHSVPWDGTVNSKVESNQRAQDCLLPMGITSENVAERYGVGREQQDCIGYLTSACRCGYSEWEIQRRNCSCAHEAGRSQGWRGETGYHRCGRWNSATNHARRAGQTQAGFQERWLHHSRQYIPDQ